MRVVPPPLGNEALHLPWFLSHAPDAVDPVTTQSASDAQGTRHGRQEPVPPSGSSQQQVASGGQPASRMSSPASFSVLSMIAPSGTPPSPPQPPSPWAQ